MCSTYFYLRDYDESAGEPATPPGTGAIFFGTTVPTGYLLCDGSAVSRTTYAALFAVIGTTYGAGDTTTTFNLPDMRGLFPRGAGTNATRTKANGGFVAGGTVGAYANDKMQGRKFQASANGGLTATGITGGMSFSGLSSANPLSGESRYADIPVTDGTNGPPRTGDKTAPASLSVNYIIKY